jgi:hypothetical protein
LAPIRGSARILQTSGRAGVTQPEKSDRMRTKLFHTIVLFGAALGGATACSDGGDDSGETQQDQNRAGMGGSNPDTGGTDSGGTASGGTTSGGTHAGGTAGTCVQGIATPPPSGSAAGGTSGTGAMIPCGGWPTTK